MPYWATVDVEACLGCGWAAGAPVDVGAVAALDAGAVDELDAGNLAGFEELALGAPTSGLRSSGWTSDNSDFA